MLVDQTTNNGTKRGNKAADSEAAAAIQKNAAKFLAFDWKYTLVACDCGNHMFCSSNVLSSCELHSLNVMEKADF